MFSLDDHNSSIESLPYVFLEAIDRLLFVMSMMLLWEIRENSF